MEQQKNKTTMEAKELMLNDWAEMRLPGGKILGYDQVKRLDMINNGQLVASPILFTEEIAKANREIYNVAEDNGVIVYEICNELNFVMFRFRYFKKKGFCLFHINERAITFMYVHTFQHILRICGLTELADNLKLR